MDPILVGPPPAIPGGRRWDGPYDAMAEYLRPAAETAIGSLIDLGARPGRRPLLDVATGSGNAADAAQRRGFTVVGIDVSAAQLARARVRLAPGGRTGPPRLVRADAEALPFAGGGASTVVSVFGVIFARRPEDALAELARCVEPGDPVAVTCWRGGGWPDACRTALGGALDRPPPPFPVGLGPDGRVESAMAAAGLVDVEVGAHSLEWWFDDLDDAVDELTHAAGGLRALRAELEAVQRWDLGRAALRATLAPRLGTRADRTGVVLVESYLLATARRR